MWLKETSHPFGFLDCASGFGKPRDVIQHSGLHRLPEVDCLLEVPHPSPRHPEEIGEARSDPRVPDKINLGSESSCEF